MGSFLYLFLPDLCSVAWVYAAAWRSSPLDYHCRVPSACPGQGLYHDCVGGAMRRFLFSFLAVLLLVLPVLAEEAEDVEILEEVPKEEPATVPDLPPESVDLTEEPPAESPVVSPEPLVPDADIGEDSALGSLDLSGPIPVIVLPAPEPPDPEDEDELLDEDEVLGDDFLEDELLEDEPVDPVPIPVIIVEDDPSYAVAPRAGSASGLVIGDDPPANPLFYGSGWVTGVDSRLGRVTVYLPITYKSGYLGVDRSGYLFNVSASSLSGYLAGVYNNALTASGFSYFRYRVPSGSSYTYYDLHLIPEHSNMDIAVDLVPRYTVDAFLPYIMILFLGGCILCFMKRS